MKSNFQRSLSKVWWSNDEPQKNIYHRQPMYGSLRGIELQSNVMSPIAEDQASTPPTIIQRRDSPGSLRSQDSGFSDSDNSPNSTHCSQPNKSPVDENRNYLKISPNKLELNNNVNHQLNEISISNEIMDRSGSNCSEAQTPPTVIRKHSPFVLDQMKARRISFSAPSSPSSPSQILSNFSSLNGCNSPGYLADVSMQHSNTTKLSLHRGRSVTPEKGQSYRKMSQQKLLACVSHVSGSADDIYTLSYKQSKANTNPCTDSEHIYETVASLSSRWPQQAEKQTPVHRRVTSRQDTVCKFNSVDSEETVLVSIDTELETKLTMQPPPSEEKFPLPTYDELYPNETSTPKFSKKTPMDKSAASINQTVFLPCRNQLFSNESLGMNIDLSLSAIINWETCTYIEYTNPLLNGHASSVQFWLDESRASYSHEILSTLQTKSVLHEAAKGLKMNATIAAKLIYQIQLKALHIEGNFDEVESVFVAHARASGDVDHIQSEQRSYFDEDQFKEIIPNIVKQLICNVSLFISKLNSRVIFQPIVGVDNKMDALRNFEESAKTVLDMSQDLQVACDTKIDDIEAHKLLEDLYSLKYCVLKVIRKIYYRLMYIIVSRIETSTNELLLQACVNTISALPLESNIYNHIDSFASLNKAFIDTGAIRVLLLVCIDTEQTSIRIMALRALSTICSTSEMIEQFLEMGGIYVVTNLLMDEKKTAQKCELEIREAISVLTQVTAPWHSDNHVPLEEFLRFHADKLVTRITILLEQIVCPQTLILCTACLNNLSKKTDLASYSLMSNRSIIRIKQASETMAKHREFIDARVFIYEQITTMIFNMAGNKKCHQHLANKVIINYITLIFQSQFHLKFAYRSETIAKMKTIKNILHIFSRLLHNSTVGNEILEHTISPIFSRVEQNLNKDSTYSRDIMYINKKLNRSISMPNSNMMNRFIDCCTTEYDRHRHKFTVSTATNSLESYV